MKITEISVTPIPSYYPKELGKNAFSDNIGKQRLEWIVRARTDGGVEGITIANRAMRQGGVEDLLKLLKTSLLGREVDSLLQVQDGVVTGAGAEVARTFRSTRWMDALAFDLYGKAHNVSAISLLGGKVREMPCQPMIPRSTSKISLCQRKGRGRWLKRLPRRKMSDIGH